jgi:surface antigen
MGTKAVLAAALSASFLLSSCATGPDGPTNNESTGAVVGSVLGAIIGAAVFKNKAEGAALGALLGGATGFAVGSYLDKRERQALAEASRHALDAPTGKRLEWTSQAPAAAGAPTVTTASGWLIPVSDPYVAPNGQTCRKIQRGVVKNGRTRQEERAFCKAQSGWDVPV